MKSQLKFFFIEPPSNKSIMNDISINARKEINITNQSKRIEPRVLQKLLHNLH